MLSVLRRFKKLPPKTQLVDFICPWCEKLMGTVDFARPDYFKQESDIFFSGLGHWNRANHKPTCPVLWSDLISFSPRAMRHGEAANAI